MKPSLTDRIRSISLKWKLLIPFLFFAFSGTIVLVTIGLTSQQNLIKEEERKGLIHFYRHFLAQIDQKNLQALSLATMIAEIPEVQRLLSERDREALRDLLIYTYVKLRMDFNIDQFHFHLPPATSFLRLHYLTKFGDDMSSYRKTILDALEGQKGVAGLEWGATGFGLRGVAPVFRYGKIVGSVEIGHAFGEALLEEFCRTWGIELALYEARGDGVFTLMAKSGRGPGAFLGNGLLPRIGCDDITILIAPEERPDRAILLGPVKDYSGRVAAAVEVSVDRSEIRSRLSKTTKIMVAVGLAGIMVSFSLTYLVAFLFIRPIKEIVREAQDIADEKREIRLDSRPEDEIGVLTRALNAMLDTLRMRRREIEKHAVTLEKRVRERTADLVESEEKYRTLVENVPLIVYRVLGDGTTEFINSYLTESLGYSIEEAVGDKGFWAEKICGGGMGDSKDLGAAGFPNGEERRVERLVKDKKGRVLTFIDHAIPARGPDGEIKWIDGIMMDITALKRLQERALLTEETRILGGISAHMAHEIRNPLITAGGFARRLRDALPAGDPNRKLAEIIVEEAARLENFLKALISSIRPFELTLSEVDLNRLLELWIERLEGRMRFRRIEPVLDLAPGLSRIQGDEERLSQALESILKHAIISMPEGEKFFIRTRQGADNVMIVLRHRVQRLTEDDLDKFFFPHIENEAEWALLDLPFSKIVIHRHRGRVELVQEGDNVLEMRIELPIGASPDTQA